MDGALADIPAEDLALSQMAQVILCWGQTAYSNQSPLAMANGVAVLRADIAARVRAPMIRCCVGLPAMPAMRCGCLRVWRVRNDAPF